MIRVYGASGKEAPIQGITFTHSSPGGDGNNLVSADNPVTNIRILSNKIYDFYAVYATTTNTAWADGIEIGNNQAFNHQGYFNLTDKTRKLTIHDNIIQQKTVGNSYGAHTVMQNHTIVNSSITNNSINEQSGGRSYAGIEVSGTDLGSSYNVVISGNKVHYTMKKALFSSEADRATRAAYSPPERRP